MTAETEYLGDLDPDDPRTPSQQIANKLRAAILTGKLKAGDKLPSQPDLATRYGVARETVKAALRVLQTERLIVSRQGSGSYVRAQTERPVGLRPHIEAAFESAHVSIDFAGFSGETLHNTLIEVLDKVRAGRLRPESLKVRIMMIDTSALMPLPRRVGTDSAEPAIKKRADRITRRAVDSIVDAVHELADLGLIKSADAEVRVHELTPAFKLYIINGSEVFYGLYPVARHSIRLEGESVEIFDLLGKDTTLFHFSATDDSETSNAPQFVKESKAWFDALWETISREYEQ
ncbi:winged helix-turn-helix domain-containing protein [Actinomadura sp. NEAU-AAG7]|uniref:winged helix-turn-helix domain-containing protein n=1 Tax=Actinomadura sp. NEAU-AAG7 TaxID=2839640 RepID=UPI001BE4C38F|nr:winged helix-turn-helix domain-containing protein [Actinomadura sp. NEAU-AAG7]MBT2210322.1 winged helix-turn-helix domain-containing protein [Actinomadura sp. NEAU-AAG7]